jgi:hypothetical protein
VRNRSETASQLAWDIEDELKRRDCAVEPVGGTVDQQTVFAIKACQQNARLAATGKATTMNICAAAIFSRRRASSRLDPTFPK